MRVCIHSSQYNPQIHTIVSGPYYESSCGGGCISVTTTTSTTSSTTTTTTTQDPNASVPPMINAPNIFNLNDSQAFISTQISYDGGISWIPYLSFYLDPNSNHTLSVQHTDLIRANATLAGGSPSQWSNEFVYTNTDHIITPIVNTPIIYNSNLFLVRADVQISYDEAISWVPYHSFNIESNTTATLVVSNTTLIRVRFAKIGDGTSVSSWSPYPSPHTV